MKRQRKRSNAFYAMLLSTVLAVAMIAPAATAFGVEEVPDETDEVEAIEEEADECVLHVDLEGELRYQEKYTYDVKSQRYKKQEFVPGRDGVKKWKWKLDETETQYKYKKQEWVPEIPAVEGVKEYRYHKVEHPSGTTTVVIGGVSQISPWQLTAPTPGATVQGLVGTWTLETPFHVGRLGPYMYTLYEERWKDGIEPKDAVPGFWKWRVPHSYSGWLGEGEQIDTKIGSVGLVDPDEEFSFAGKTYRYTQVDTKTVNLPTQYKWSVDSPGEGWVKTHHWVWKVTPQASYWKWVVPFRVTGWIEEGDKIDSGIWWVGLVEPDEEFSFGGKTYRYVKWGRSKTDTFKDWFTEDPGAPWNATGRTKVFDAEPNEVRVTINGEVVVEESYGESYTESFLLDHGDTYLVEYKLHGDEDWQVDQEGIADCIQPDDLVTFSEWEDGELACDSENVTLTRTKTTTPFIWDPETRTWVEDTDNILEEGEEDTRELTAEEEQWQESEECIEVIDTVEEKEPKVEEVAVKKTVETKVLAETLPRTGASVIALLVTGLLALFAGGGALRIRRRHER